VFFKQLLCWLLHGQLQDQYEEFFIVQTTESATLPSTAAADLLASDGADVVTGTQLSLIMASTVILFRIF